MSEDRTVVLATCQLVEKATIHTARELSECAFFFLPLVKQIKQNWNTCINTLWPTISEMYTALPNTVLSGREEDMFSP